MDIDYSFYISQLEERKRLSAREIEYWRARDLQRLLGYQEWRTFEGVIAKAIDACKSAGVSPDHHFVGAPQKVRIGGGSLRQRVDWFVTRYACYLIAMNGDSRKPEIGYAQTYFAVQTRRQELQSETAIEQRLMLREQMKGANKSLSGAQSKLVCSASVSFMMPDTKGCTLAWDGMKSSNSRVLQKPRICWTA